MTNVGFGKMLRAYRKKHNMTQRELAELMNISPNHVSVLERGHKLPRASTIAAFEMIAAKDDLERYLSLDTMSEVEITDYLRMIRLIREMEGGRKQDVLRAITGLLDVL